MGTEQMSPYDRAAWDHSLKVLIEPPGRGLIPARLRNAVSGWSAAGADRVGDLPGAQSAREIVEKAFEGTLALTFQPALRSVRPGQTARRYRRDHPRIRTLDDVRALPLRDRDPFVPPRLAYTAGSAGQGAVTALAVTGAEVSATVTGGVTAGVAVAAVAADSVASLAAMGRTIGAVASSYGYDVRVPEEELFAMGVLSLGVANSMAAKTQALASLSRLTQQMMRRATWEQLNEHVLVRVIARVYQLLGFRITKQKLGQMLPFIGVGVNATLSARLTDHTFRRAQAVYRLRALSEIYGIDPADWVDGRPPAAPSDPGASETVVDVAGELERERATGDE